MSAQAPTIAANAPITGPTGEMNLLMQGYSPATAVAAQRSQYLAQALQNMQAQGQNIRTPVALGSNLLAEALLQRKYGQSMQDFAKASQADQGQMFGPNSPLMGVLGRIAGGDQGGASSAPVAPSGPAPAPDAAVPPPPPQPTPQNTQPMPRGLRDNNPLNITTLGGGQTWNGQTGADGPYAVFGDQQAGWNAADKNLSAYFTRHGLNTVNGIVSRWAPAAGSNNPQAYAATVADQLRVDPNQPLDLSTPDKRAPLLRAMAGVELGQTYGGPQSPPSPSPSPGAVQSAPGGTASAAPAAASPAAGASAPGFANRPYIAPERAKFIQAEIANPMTRAQGLQDAYALAKEYQSGDQWDIKADPSTGQTIFTSKTRPGVSFATETQGARSAPPAGMQWGPDGRVHPIPGTEYSPLAQVNGTNVLGQYGPDGQFHGGPQLDFGVQQRVGLSKELSGQLTGSPEYQKFTEARSALVGFRNAIEQMKGANNGVLGVAGMDSYLRGVNPGASARSTTVQMFMDHLGWPQELQGMVLNATGNGFLTPHTLQQMDQVMQAYTAAHGAEVQKIHQNHLAIASQAGIDEKGLGEDIGQIPQPMTLRFGGAPPPAQAGASAAQTARTAGASVANAAANLPHLSPQQAAALPAGTPFLTLDGRPRTAHGPAR